MLALFLASPESARNPGASAATEPCPVARSQGCSRATVSQVLQRSFCAVCPDLAAALLKRRSCAGFAVVYNFHGI
jgi:hypothetical protein